MRKSARPKRRQKRQLEGMELDEFGGLDDQDDPTAEARIEASIDERLQARPGVMAVLRAQVAPERLAVLRAQMARDLSSLMPKKKPKHGWHWPQTGG